MNITRSREPIFMQDIPDVKLKKSCNRDFTFIPFYLVRKFVFFYSITDITVLAHLKFN